jgi:hypothetical protein
MTDSLRNLRSQEEGQDIAEYAVMLAVMRGVRCCLKSNKRVFPSGPVPFHAVPIRADSDSRL